MQNRKIDIEKYIPEYLRSTVDGDKTDFYKLFETFESLLNYSYKTSFYENINTFTGIKYQFDMVDSVLKDTSFNIESYEKFTELELDELKSKNYIFKDISTDNTYTNQYYDNYISRLYDIITFKSAAFSGLPLTFISHKGKTAKNILSVNLINDIYYIDSESIPTANFYTNEYFSKGDSVKYYNETVFGLADFIWAGRSPITIDSEMMITGAWMDPAVGQLLNSNKNIRTRILDLTNKTFKAYVGYSSKSISEYESLKLNTDFDDPTGSIWANFFTGYDPRYFNAILGSCVLVLTELLLTYFISHIQSKTKRFELLCKIEDITSAIVLSKTYLECTRDIDFLGPIIGSFSLDLSQRSNPYFENLVLDKNAKILLGSYTSAIVSNSSLWVPSNYYGFMDSIKSSSITTPRKLILKNKEYLNYTLNFASDFPGGLWGELNHWALHRLNFSKHLSSEALNMDINSVSIPFSTIETTTNTAANEFFGFPTPYFYGPLEEMAIKYYDVDNTPLNDFIESEMLKAFGPDNNYLPTPYDSILSGNIKKTVRRFYRLVIAQLKSFYSDYFAKLTDSYKLLNNVFSEILITPVYNIESSEDYNLELSVLEKMDEVQYIADAEKTSIDNLASIVKSMGFNIDIDINDIALLRFNSNYIELSEGKKTEVRLIARRFVKSIPSIIECKTTKSLINGIFAIFGINTTVLDYYTKDYSETDTSKWIQTSIDDSAIASQYFPTSHFGVSIQNKYDIETPKVETLGDLSINPIPAEYLNPMSSLYLYPNNPEYEEFLYKGFDTLVRIIDSIRPVNSVFRGIFLNIFLKDLNKLNLVTDVVINEKLHIPWTTETAPEYVVIEDFGGAPYYIAKPAGVAHEHITQGSNEIPESLIEYSFNENTNKEYSYEINIEGDITTSEDYALSNVVSIPSFGKTEIQSYSEIDNTNKYFVIDQANCETVDKINLITNTYTSSTPADRFKISRVYINRVYDCNATGGSNVIIEPDVYVNVVTNLKRSTNNTKIIVSGLGLPGLNEVQITELNTGGSHYTTMSGSSETNVGSFGTGDVAEPNFTLYNKWFLSASWYDPNTKAQMLFNPVFDRQELPSKVELELSIYFMTRKSYALSPTNKIRYFIIPLKVDWNPLTVSGRDRRTGLQWQSAQNVGQFYLFNSNEAYYDTNDGFEAFELYPTQETEFFNYNNRITNYIEQNYTIGATDFYFPSGYKAQNVNTQIFKIKVDVTGAVRRTLNQYGHSRFAIVAAPVGINPYEYHNVYFATSKLPDWGAELRPKIYVEYPSATITPPLASNTLNLSPTYPTPEPAAIGSTTTNQSINFIGRRMIELDGTIVDLPTATQVITVDITLMFTQFPSTMTLLDSSNGGNAIRINNGVLDLSEATNIYQMTIDNTQVTSGVDLPLNRWIQVTIVYNSASNIAMFGARYPGNQDLKAIVGSIKYYNSSNALLGHFSFMSGTSSIPNLAPGLGMPAATVQFNQSFPVKWYPTSYPDQPTIINYPDVANYPDDSPTNIGDTRNFTDGLGNTLNYTAQRVIWFSGTKGSIYNVTLSNARKIKIQFMLTSVADFSILFDTFGAINRFVIEAGGALNNGANIQSILLNGQSYDNTKGLTALKWYDAEITFSSNLPVYIIGCGDPGLYDVKALIRAFDIQDASNNSLFKINFNTDYQGNEVVYPSSGPGQINLEYNHSASIVWVPTSFLSTIS